MRVRILEGLEPKACNTEDRLQEHNLQPFALLDSITKGSASENREQSLLQGKSLHSVELR